VLDARRCIAWLVQSADPIPAELRPAVGERLYGCDVCQEVCPPNRAVARRVGDADEVAAPGRETPDEDGPSGDWVDLDELLLASDAELLERHGRWYIADRDPDVIRRTALVILGNSGDGDDPSVAELLARYLTDPNPLLRSHAAWACRRLGLDSLAGSVADDPDPGVRQELDGWVEPAVKVAP
jgi:epoxyqueuosine reductase